MATPAVDKFENLYLQLFAFCFFSRDGTRENGETERMTSRDMYINNKIGEYMSQNKVNLPLFLFLFYLLFLYMLMFPIGGM